MNLFETAAMGTMKLARGSLMIALAFLSLEFFVASQLLIEVKRVFFNVYADRAFDSALFIPFGIYGAYIVRQWGISKMAKGRE